MAQRKDSRSQVVAAAKLRERAAQQSAPLYVATASRVAELRRIAQTVYTHDERIKGALRTGWLTAEEIAAHLDSREPHARLSGLRAAGVPIASRWVKTPTTTGNTRRVRAYALPEGA